PRPAGSAPRRLPGSPRRTARLLLGSPGRPGVRTGPRTRRPGSAPGPARRAPGRRRAASRARRRAGPGRARTAPRPGPRRRPVRPGRGGDCRPRRRPGRPAARSAAWASLRVIGNAAYTPPRSSASPCRSGGERPRDELVEAVQVLGGAVEAAQRAVVGQVRLGVEAGDQGLARAVTRALLRSEEHTSELQSREHLVCRLLLDKRQ